MEGLSFQPGHFEWAENETKVTVQNAFVRALTAAENDTHDIESAQEEILRVFKLGFPTLEWDRYYREARQLKEFYRDCQDRYKDAKLLRVYIGFQANAALEVIHQETIFEDSRDHITLIACGDIIHSNPGEYMDGAYSIDITDGILYMSWMPYPNKPIKGKEDIFATLDKYQHEITIA